MRGEREPRFAIVDHQMPSGRGLLFLAQGMTKFLVPGEMRVTQAQALGWFRAVRTVPPQAGRRHNVRRVQEMMAGGAQALQIRLGVVLRVLVQMVNVMRFPSAAVACRLSGLRALTTTVLVVHHLDCALVVLRHAFAVAEYPPAETPVVLQTTRPEALPNERFRACPAAPHELFPSFANRLRSACIPH